MVLISGLWRVVSLTSCGELRRVELTCQCGMRKVHKSAQSMKRLSRTEAAHDRQFHHQVGGGRWTYGERDIDEVRANGADDYVRCDELRPRLPRPADLSGCRLESGQSWSKCAQRKEGADARSRPVQQTARFIHHASAHLPVRMSESHSVKTSSEAAKVPVARPVSAMTSQGTVLSQSLASKPAAPRRSAKRSFRCRSFAYSCDQSTARCMLSCRPTTREMRLDVLELPSE